MAGAETADTDAAEQFANGQPKRFYSSAELDPLRVGRDAAQIGEVIVEHPRPLVDAKREVRLQIQADIPDGALDDVARTVTENARTVEFTKHGFEREWEVASRGKRAVAVDLDSPALIHVNAGASVVLCTLMPAPSS